MGRVAPIILCASNMWISNVQYFYKWRTADILVCLVCQKL
jgi:hypothetical protein